MKILTGLQRALYNAIKAGSPSNQMVVVHKARHPMRLARALERRGFITVTRWDGSTYFAQLTGKDPDAPPPAKAKRSKGRPKLGPEKRIKTSIQIPPEIAAKVKNLATSWKKSKSVIIIDILSSFFDK